MLQQLIANGFAGRDVLAEARESTALWENWLFPISPEAPTGDDPAYNDDFQRMREEVNKLSGIDTALIGELAQKLLTTECKDVRVATYYVWARLHQEGERGLAEGLALLAALVERFGEALLPCRAGSRKAALEWLTGGKMQDSLSLYPEVNRIDFEHILASLALLEQVFATWDEDVRPSLTGLAGILETRLAQSGGMAAVVPQTTAQTPLPLMQSNPSISTPRGSPVWNPVQSGRDLLERTRELARYLREQPQGWLSSARLMRSVRWDTVHQLPPQDGDGRTRLLSPRKEYRALLKRLYRQQSWHELLEQAERMFAEGVNHFWLDLQWYLCQALSQPGGGYEGWGEIIKQDLRILLERLPGLENLAYDDGSPFADEVTAGWITQQIHNVKEDWSFAHSPAQPRRDDDILALEPEALQLADSEGIDAALSWLGQLPGINGARHRWLQRLLMARVAEQYGKNEIALHLLTGLNADEPLRLDEWEPELMFEVKACLLKLLRMKAQRSEHDKGRMAQRMETLFAGLVAIDPVRAVVLCG
ncbi:type VI secretion system ImpA domain-containing protein [Photorhabdus temperata]|uniref:Type VI secretion-associated protein, VC_A0119 family n=1 Tax=Photorhabdus khanii NC19 TaxID=1004151 RepID=W3V6I1_9GAMM|nr:type VI secretion system protein TssA [Photorhabdus khanii]ETS30725.1 type VI secretion-associated protein, VC_A0119 family [Photorhabdus khanii NC19]OHV55812.1 type VI secretion system ImpA domain-containing protein [Photorhabdus temperata]